MKKLIPLIIIILISCVLEAQQLPLFNQYREHQTLINPAATSTEYNGYKLEPNSSLGLSYRYQWTGLSSGPRTMTARYEHIEEDLNMVFGVSFIRDQTGPTSTTGGYLRYAYVLPLSRYSSLSIGIAAGILQNKFNGGEEFLRDKDDELGNAVVNTMYFDATMGVFYETEVFGDDQFYFGISVPQVVTPKLSSGELLFTLDRDPHFFIHTGLNKKLDDTWGDLFGGTPIHIEPALWFKYTKNAPSQLDLNVRIHLANAFWIGTGYSLAFSDQTYGNNIHVETGVNLFTKTGNIIKIGYGYDRSITTFGPFFGDVHEINLSYAFLR